MAMMPHRQSLVCPIFIEVKTTLLLVIEVEVFLGKFQDCIIVLGCSKSCRGVDSEAICMISGCWMMD